MKKIKWYVLCFFMLCMVACGSGNVGNNYDYMVKVVNNTSVDIYGIGYYFYINGNVVNSGGACNADNSVIKNGEAFFLEQISDGEAFSVEFSVADKNGKEYFCPTKMEIKRGEQYTIQIVGDFEKGFEIK